MVVRCASVPQSLAPDRDGQGEQMFAARALVVGWKQSFLEYYRRQRRWIR